MCTLSFIPSNDEFLAAMNRDELRTRPTALPPRTFDLDGTEAIFPRERGGGTWIACNDAGNLMALLNWHTAGRENGVEDPRTRGSIIPALISGRSPLEVAYRLTCLDLKPVLPFRLICVFRAEAQVREWKWDGCQLVRVEHPWAHRHWFSSSISDVRATEERLYAIECASFPSLQLDETWLRDIHSSHLPSPGRPYRRR